MLQFPAIASLFALLSYKLLRVLLIRHLVVNPPALLEHRLRAVVAASSASTSTPSSGSGTSAGSGSDMDSGMSGSGGGSVSASSMDWKWNDGDDQYDDGGDTGSGDNYNNNAVSRPLPSRVASDKEESALLESLRSHRGIVAVKVYKAARSAQESFLRNELYGEPDRRVFTAHMRNRRALADFFRDTGGRVSDLRVLRSAMFLSDEIDRAVRGIDLPHQHVGWRPYNRFYADGTQDLFTNVPTGRSPLVLAAPKTRVDLSTVDNRTATYPVEYQATRRSKIQQVGRALDEIEQSELSRLVDQLPMQQHQQQQQDVRPQQSDASDHSNTWSFLNNRLTRAQRESIAQYKQLRLQQQRQRKSDITTTTTTTTADGNGDDSLTHLLSSLSSTTSVSPGSSITIRPSNLEDRVHRNTSDIHSGLYQPYRTHGPTLKQRLLHFEGELEDKKLLEDFKSV